MKQHKIEMFMKLAGQKIGRSFNVGTEAERKLGAQLLLSEVLEYVISGLGIVPEVNGVRITNPESLHYHASDEPPNLLEMLDGLADVAYTMYWNSAAFGVPLEKGFELVCDNNLEKFVKLENWKGGERSLEKTEWECGRSVTWPSEVVSVSAVAVDGEYYAVGKDARGKVRKPSTYTSVDLSSLIPN